MIGRELTEEQNNELNQLIEETKKKIELWNQRRAYVETEEYKNWLVGFLDNHKFLSDFEDNYLYNKPNYITDIDMNNINSLSTFWDYKNPYKEIESCEEFEFDRMFTILPDETITIEMQGNEYEFERIAGCGCYVYTIEIKE